MLIKALKKYIKSEPVRKERVERKKTLGEVMKKHRVDCKMTQEYVSETIGVSRQAVSKWENGITDPSTTNLIVLANLFGVEADELLKETKSNLVCSRQPLVTACFSFRNIKYKKVGCRLL